MNKYSPEIATLRMDIEQSVKRKIRTPYDFEFLASGSSYATNNVTY